MAVEGRVLGMAASLLGLILAGVGYTAHQGQVIDRSAQRLRTQVDPLLADIARVERAVAQQHQAVETLWHLRLQRQTPGTQTSARTSGASLEAQTQRFWGQGQAVDEAIKAALVQLETMPNVPPTLGAQWQGLERTHQQFQDQSDHLLTLVAQGRWQEAQSLDRTLTQDLHQVQADLADLRLALLDQAQLQVQAGQFAQGRAMRFQGIVGAIALVLGGTIAGSIAPEVQRRLTYWDLRRTLGARAGAGEAGTGLAGDPVVFAAGDSAAPAAGDPVAPAHPVSHAPWVPAPIVETRWTRLVGFPLSWEAAAATLHQRHCIESYLMQSYLANQTPKGTGKSENSSSRRFVSALDDRSFQTLCQTAGFGPLLAQAQIGTPLTQWPPSRTLLWAKVTGWEPWLAVKEADSVTFGVGLFCRGLAAIAPELWGLPDGEGAEGQGLGELGVRWRWPLWGQASAALESVARPEILAAETALRHQEIAQALSLAWVQVFGAGAKAAAPIAVPPMPPVVTWAIVSAADSPKPAPAPPPPPPLEPDLEQRSQHLQALAQRYGVAMVLDRTTRDRLPLGWETRQLTPFPAAVYELLGTADRLAVQRLALRDLFEKGLRHVQERDNRAAASAFAACLVLNPDDRPSQAYAQWLAQGGHPRNRPDRPPSDGAAILD